MTMISYKPRGAAIILALMLVTAGLTTMLAVLTMSTSNSESQSASIGQESAYYAAMGAVEASFSDIYNTNTFPTYAEYLKSEAFGMTGALDGTKSIDFKKLVGMRIGSSTVRSIKIWAADYPDAMRDGSLAPALTLTIEAEAESDFGDRSVVAKSYYLQQDPVSTIFKFIMVTNNASCVMCHAQFRNIDKVQNDLARSGNGASDPKFVTGYFSGKWPDGDEDGRFQGISNFERVRMGSLKFMEIRSSSALTPVSQAPSASVLEGSLYARGNIVNNNFETYGSPGFPAIAQNALSAVQFGAPREVTTSGDYKLAKSIWITPIRQDNSVAAAADAYFGRSTLSGSPTAGVTQPNIFSDAQTVGGVLQPFANLYPDYPQPGGEPEKEIALDSDFPLPFPEADGRPKNRIVDSDEALNLVKEKAKINSSTGQPELGKISGGTIIIADPSATYTAATLGATPSGFSTVAELTNGLGDAAAPVKKNVILIGTKENPVNLDRQLIVDGDVIIKGYYKGKGSVWATGNIYVPSDLKYANTTLKKSDGVTDVVDGNGQPVEDWGVGARDGSGEIATENLGGLVAGKNILIGDYLSGTGGYGESYTPPDMAFDTDYYTTKKTRTEGNPLIPAYQTATGVAYNTVKVDPKGATGLKTVPRKVLDEDGKAADINLKNFTQAQLEIFNREEYSPTQPTLPNSTGALAPNSKYDGGVTPRYYTLNENDPVNVAVLDSKNAALATELRGDRSATGGGKGTYWDDGAGIWRGVETTQGYQPKSLTDQASDFTRPYQTVKATQGAKNSDGTTNLSNGTKAAVINLNPNWISNDNMWKMLVNEEANRAAEPLRVDGLLYTNNSIFSIQRQRTIESTEPLQPVVERLPSSQQYKSSAKYFRYKYKLPQTETTGTPTTYQTKFNWTKYQYKLYWTWKKTEPPAYAGGPPVITTGVSSTITKDWSAPAQPAIGTNGIPAGAVITGTVQATSPYPQSSAQSSNVNHSPTTSSTILADSSGPADYQRSDSTPKSKSLVTNAGSGGSGPYPYSGVTYTANIYQDTAPPSTTSPGSYGVPSNAVRDDTANGVNPTAASKVIRIESTTASTWSATVTFTPPPATTPLPTNSAFGTPSGATNAVVTIVGTVTLGDWKLKGDTNNDGLLSKSESGDTNGNSVIDSGETLKVDQATWDWYTSTKNADAPKADVFNDDGKTLSGVTVPGAVSGNGIWEFQDSNGNGKWDWNDANGNGIQDSGETGEPAERLYVREPIYNDWRDTQVAKGNLLTTSTSGDTNDNGVIDIGETLKVSTAQWEKHVYAYNLLRRGVYAKEKFSKSKGRIIINGSIAAPDLGILAIKSREFQGNAKEKAFTVNYDKRVARLVKLTAVRAGRWTQKTIGLVKKAPSADSDSDGYSNVEERLLGSDPYDRTSKPE